MSAQPNKLEDIQIALNMQKQIMLEHNGRPDCKNCSLAEVIQEILDREEEDHTLQAKQYTRLEVIDHTDQGTGREYSKWVSEPFTVKFDEQDDGRTLKIFLEDGVPSNE